MELRFKIFNQKIKRVDSNFIVSDSKNYLTASFDFSEEWDRCAKTVIFERGSDAYEVVLNSEGECLVPHEVLKLGSFKVSAFGTRDEMTVITTDCVKLDVAESGLLEGQTPAEPTPDIYAQILGIAEDAERIAQSVRDDADEGLFKGEQGEPGTTDYNELENKPDLSVYATTEEVDEKIANIPGVTNVYTREETDSAIESAVEALAEGQVATNTADIANKADASAVYTKEQADSAISTAVNGKADKSTTLTGYGITDAYTKTETDNAISSLQTAVAGKADKDSVYTKAETEEKISDYALSVDTKYGVSLSLTLNTSTYVLTVQLKDQNGNDLGTPQTVDLPLESVVVGGSYDDTTKKVKLTLQNGNSVEFSVANLVAGLQTEITDSNKLSADLVDDTTTVNKFVKSSEKTTWNNKQNAISDLETIRSGASDGTTALSKVVNVEATIPTLATKSELPTLVDLAQAGTGIEFERKVQAASNNYTITGSPDIDANGIFTCNSTANYITSPTFETFNDTIFEFEFTTPSTISSTSSIIQCLQQGNVGVFTIGLTTAYRISISGTIGSGSISTVLSPDTSYTIRYKRVGNDNTFTLLSSDGTELGELVKTDTITTITSPFFRIGRTAVPVKFDLNKMSFGDWIAKVPAFNGYEISSTGTDISSHKVNGAPLSNTSSYFFGECETAGNIPVKVVSIPSITELNVGQIIIVRPTYEATSGAQTKLKLNEFEAYPLKYGVDTVNTTNDGYMLVAGRPSIFVFDGEYWVFAGQGFRTVYNAMTVSNGISATGGTAQLVSPVNLKQIIQGTTLTGIDVSTSGTVSATDSITTAIGKLQAQITTSVGNIETALNTINSGV